MAKEISEMIRLHLERQDIREEERQRLMDALSVLELPDREQKRLAMIEETYALLDRVREPSLDELQRVSTEDRVYNIKPISLAQLTHRNLAHFAYRKLPPSFRDYIPPQMSVRMPWSYLWREFKPEAGNTHLEQLERIAAFSQEVVEPRCPSARAVMFPAAVYAQMDMQGTRYSPNLFEHFAARTIDRATGGNAVHVGRGERWDRLRVNMSKADQENRNAIAVPGIIFIK